MDADDGSLSEALVATVERDHLVRTPVEPADLLFVFGTRHAVDAFAETAAELWRRGFYRWAMVTGGPTAGIAEDEAATLARRMVEAGVPAEAILTEHRATNTGENVIFSLPILEARLGLANIHSLIALGKATTSVRYLMTLHRHWPQVRKMLVTVNHLPYPMEEWPKHPELRDMVLAEWRKVAAYRDLGFISDWP